MLGFVAVLAVLSSAPSDADWRVTESAYLKNIRQLTRDEDFARAGEGYFSPDGTSIIFQAEERGSKNPFYQIYTLELKTGKFRRVSNGIGKTTCAFYRPDGKKIIYASTHLDPEAAKHYDEEFRQRKEESLTKKRRRYVWDFDQHFDIFEADLDGSNPRRLTTTAGYDAEGSYSSDGRQIVFCSNRSGEKNLELYIMGLGENGKQNSVRQLTKAPNCYNGGPFFSPDNKRVIFRSDRKKADHLQLYVINADGTEERALTDDLNWVQWAPYWYRDNRHIIYTGADHRTLPPNYDLYWMNVDTGNKVRITSAPGADVLPVFSPDGKRVLWTSTREGRRPAQLYLADFVPPPSRATEGKDK